MSPFPLPYIVQWLLLWTSRKYPDSCWQQLLVSRVTGTADVLRTQFTQMRTAYRNHYSWQELGPVLTRTQELCWAREKCQSPAFQQLSCSIHTSSEVSPALRQTGSNSQTTDTKGRRLLSRGKLSGIEVSVHTQHSHLFYQDLNFVTMSRDEEERTVCSPLLPRTAVLWHKNIYISSSRKLV